MNPKDIVYKMVVLGRRLTTHFILDIFWGSSARVNKYMKWLNQQIHFHEMIHLA